MSGDAKIGLALLIIATSGVGLVKLGYGWWVLGAVLGALLLLWLTFYMEQREVRQNAWLWELAERRQEKADLQRRQTNGDKADAP